MCSWFVHLIVTLGSECLLTMITGVHKMIGKMFGFNMISHMSSSIVWKLVTHGALEAFFTFSKVFSYILEQVTWGTERAWGRQDMKWVILKLKSFLASSRTMVSGFMNFKSSLGVHYFTTRVTNVSKESLIMLWLNVISCIGSWAVTEKTTNATFVFFSRQVSLKELIKVLRLSYI